MRLFVYGGTSYNVRRVIGEWKSFGTHLLAESYGLEENAWSIGVGVSDEAPFLILRQLQRDASHRECSFAILFDPGEENWKKFKWNPASLAYALLYFDQDLSENLIRTPEKLTEEYLQKAINELQSLRPELDDELDNKVSRFNLLLAATSFQENILTVKADDVELPVMLWDGEIRLMAEMLDRLPQCFRCGNGWLLSGTKPLAEELGAKLLIDAGYQTTTDREYEDVKNQGKRTIQVWRDIKKKENIELMSDWTQTPVFKWANIPENLIERFELLIELQKIKEISGDELLAFGERIEEIDKDHDNFLLIEINRELNRLIIAEQMFSAATTEKYIEKFSTTGKLHPSAIGKLEVKSYVQYLINNQRKPNEANLPQQLQSRQRALVWNGLIEQEKNEQELPKLLSFAINDLSVDAENDEKLQGDLIAIAKTAITRTQNLLVWEDARNQSGVKNIAAPFWAARARENFDPKNTLIVYRYLIFGEDSGGGNWLKTQPINATAFVEILEKRIKDNLTKFEAVSWLKDLAVSPLRSSLKSYKKASLAAMEELRGSKWENFQKLQTLLDSKNLIVQNISQIDDQEELKYLNEELVQFFNDNPKHELSIEQGDALKAFLGKLPPDVRIKSGQIVIKEKPFEETVKDKSVEHQPESPQIKNYGEILESAILSETFEGTIAPNLSRVVEQLKAEKENEINFAKALKNLFENEQKRGHLIKNFSLQNNPTWKNLLDVLPLKLQVEILSLADNCDHKKFFAEVEFFYGQRKTDPTKDIRGLWAYLLSEKGKTTAKELKKKLPNANDNIKVWYEKSQEDWNLVKNDEKEDSSFWSSLTKRF